LLDVIILPAIVQVFIGLCTSELDELVSTCLCQPPWCRWGVTIDKTSLLGNKASMSESKGS
jgi:hypothetical protein